MMRTHSERALACLSSAGLALAPARPASGEPPAEGAAPSTGEPSTASADEFAEAERLRVVAQDDLALPIPLTRIGATEPAPEGPPPPPPPPPIGVAGVTLQTVAGRRAARVHRPRRFVAQPAGLMLRFQSTAASAAESE